MDICEKIAYIKGLAEGLGLDNESKEGKIITALIGLVVALLGVSVFAGCTPLSSENSSSESQGSTMITLDQDSITLDADRTQQLVVSGASEVDWTSSNPQVATVDANGNVTGVNCQCIRGCEKLVCILLYPKKRTVSFSGADGIYQR